MRLYFEMYAEGRHMGLCGFFNAGAGVRSVLVKYGLAAGMVLGQGCASGYWGDRWRDTKDVATCTVGLGLGVKGRVGPLQAPLIVQSDYAGLRCGEAFTAAMRDDFWTYVSEAGHVVDTLVYPIYLRDYDMLYSGYEIFDPGGLADVRHKRIMSQGMGPFTVDEDKKNYGFYSQVELTVGLFVSLKLGVNPGELVDLLLGFAGLDVFGDDVGKSDEVSSQQPEARSFW